MIIKICGITNIADAETAAEAGATALGFNFWLKSPRFVSVEVARAIAGRLPASVWKVGLFVDEPAAQIEKIMLDAKMDVAQVHGSLDAPLAVRHWRAFAATTRDLAGELARMKAEAAVIDTPAGQARGGTGRTFDWTLAAGLPGRIVLAGGLGPDNVGEAIAAAKPWGVDACSRLESSPGIKDPEKVRAFVAAIRASCT